MGTCVRSRAIKRRFLLLVEWFEGPTTCPLSCAQVEYLPTLAGNAVYVAAFGRLLIAQLELGIKYKTWEFMVGMICGLILEVVGYAGRIMLHGNPFDFNDFIV